MISTASRAAEPPVVLTANQVAQSLQVSVRNLRGMVSQGEFPKPIRIGRLVRWSRSTIDRWVEAQSQ